MPQPKVPATHGQSPGTLPNLTLPSMGERDRGVARVLKVVASQVMVRALQVVGRGQVRESLSGTETLSLGRLAANPIGR